MSDQFNQWSVKHRPASLDTFLGSGAIKNVAEGIVRDRDHAVLISGESGCGKTTLARIIANQLTTDPNDIVEKNIGADGRIEMVRELIGTAVYAARGGCRVFILDEAHALNGASQSAILKFLEEPPHRNVCIILCTDRPHMLDKAIANRCRGIMVSKPSEDELARLLFRVINAERAFPKLTDKAQRIRLVREVARGSDFVPRVALQLLKNVSDSAESYTDFRELIVQGVRRAAEEGLHKVALKVLMAWYSPEKAADERAAFLVKTILDKDPFGLLRMVCNVHYEILASVGGVTSSSARYYCMELEPKQAIPDLHTAAQTQLRLTNTSRDLLVSNVNLSQLVVPALIDQLYVIDALRRTKEHR